MGFAFLPIGIGSFIGGWAGGSLVHHFAEVQHQPERVWWVVTAIGLATAVGLFLYDRVVKPGRAAAEGGRTT
jgi:predicted MFS family arabinose efflux permease